MARGWKIFKKKRILKAEKWIEEGNVIGLPGNPETLFDIGNHKFKMKPNSPMIFPSSINQLMCRKGKGGRLEPLDLGF